MKKISLFLLAVCLVWMFNLGETPAQQPLRGAALLGEAHQMQSQAASREQLEQALLKSQEALRFFQKRKALPPTALALHQMAVIHKKLGQYAKAIECQEQALEIRKKLGDPRGVGGGLVALAAMQSSMGRYRKSLELLEKAEKIDAKAGSGKGVGLVLIANALSKLGQNRKALEIAEKALESAKKKGNAELEGNVLLVMGQIDRNLGKYQNALGAYETALALNSKTRLPRREAVCLSHIAAIHAATGSYNTALERYQDALKIAEKLGDPHLEGGIQVYLGETYAQTENYDQALEHFDKGIQILDHAKAPTRKAKHLLANTCLDMGDLERAEPLVKEVHFDATSARFYLLKNDFDQARAHLEKLLAWGDKTGNVDALFTAYTGLGKVCEAKEDFPEAEEYYSKGMQLTEEIRSGLLPSERTHFFDVKINGFRRLEPAKGLTRVQMLRNQAADSIESSELTRARVFADDMAQRSEMGFAGVPNEVLEKEEALVGELASLKKERTEIVKENDPERYGSLGSEIKRVQTEFDALVAMLWEKYRPYAAVKYPKPVSLGNAALEPDERVVIYDILGDGLGVKLIEGKKIAQTFFIRWDIEELEHDIKSFREPFEQVKLDRFDPELGHKLYNKLLSAVLTNVPEGVPITIIPDGPLAILPFEALVVSGKASWQKTDWGTSPKGLTYLADIHPVNYQQSLTALTLARTGEKKKRGENLLVVADPVFETKDERLQGAATAGLVVKEDPSNIRLMSAIEHAENGSFKFERLPQTTDLAENLVSLFGDKGEMLTGLKANKGEFLGNVAPGLRKYGWIVLATHGLVSNRVPGITEPFLALTMVIPGTDGFLKMTDVLGLSMSADVVALPACQTGLGKELSGEGVMSMGRAFQYAGAESVLMSLWSVAEGSSVTLVEGFFKHLKEGKTNLEALSLARKDLRESGFDHPFFWAPFILLGNVR